MVNADNPGESFTFLEQLRNAHVYRREFVEAWARFEWYSGSSDSDTERFDALLEAVAKGDKSSADSILRVWGIR